MSSNRRNAVIMAAGTSSRFVPLSAECPKGLLEVKGEILIERQIRQLKEAGIDNITVVVGYMADRFMYLHDKFGVDIVVNEDFSQYNNTSSIVRVLDRLGDTYICSSDNYFPENVFREEPHQSYYSALYAEGETPEYCLSLDTDDNITDVTVGGRDSWYMIGHVFFSRDFSEAFREIFRKEYEKEETRQGYWEDVYMRFIAQLPPMKAHRYREHEIEEFDSIDELRGFDKSYVTDTRSAVVKDIASRLCCSESDILGFRKVRHNGKYLMFDFNKSGETYRYDGSDNSVTKIQ